MQLKFLTEQYYIDYAHCSEMEQKPMRPYAIVLVRAMGYDFAVPFRSHIKHNYAFWTDRKNDCGLDYSKAMIVDVDRHVQLDSRPVIRKNEFKALVGKDTEVENGLARYIQIYKDAVARPDHPRNKMVLLYSTLKYFHKELGLDPATE